MKAAYYPILRIVLTLVSGIFMIIYPAGVLSYIAIIIGLLLIIPGLIQLLRYAIVFTKRNRRDRRNSPINFPFIALLCTLAGIAIIIFSDEIVKIFSFMLATGLIIAGIYEIVMILRSTTRNMIAFYILPTLLTLLGIFILANPLNMLPHMIVILFGIGAVVYSINEIIYMARISR